MNVITLTDLHEGTLTAHWCDRGVDPQCAPNPAFPDGIDIDCSFGAEATCQIALTHPTPRCGVWVITCEICKFAAVATAAGRPDDPRSVKVACKIAATKQ